MVDHARNSEESVNEAMIVSKMRELIGQRQIIEDELKLELQRVDLVRRAADNLSELATAQEKALRVQKRMIALYSHLSGEKMDERGANAFKDHILFISTGGCFKNIEQAVVIPDLSKKPTAEEGSDSSCDDEEDSCPSDSEFGTFPANVEKAFGISPGASHASEYNPGITLEVSNESVFTMDCRSCTSQLWAMTPIGAAWRESMQFGAKFHETAREEYRMELEAKNLELGTQLGLCMLQLRMTQEARYRLMDAKQAVEAELKEAHEQLFILRQKLKAEADQDKLAKEIWGPITPPRPDTTWDLPPVLLTETVSQVPITVGGVSGDLGFKYTPSELHKLGSLVCKAFIETHGKKPELRVFYGKDGSPERVACYTESDRALISSVVMRYSKSGLQATVQPTEDPGC